MDGDGQEDGYDNRLGSRLITTKSLIGDLLPWIDPFQNLKTSGHLITHQLMLNWEEKSNHLLSFFLELFAKG
jgi:hypothetical protein